MSKHMSLADRTLIERALILGSSFTAIGGMLGRSPTTISREVRAHRTVISQRYRTKNDCLSFATCLHKNVCPNESKYTCFSRCKSCNVYDCRTSCKDYESVNCPDLNEPPYVCNGCFCEKSCKKNHAYYTAHKAHAAYLRELSESRKGLRVTPEKLEQIDALVTPLVRKGQSLNHILATHREEIGVSEKTLYNYINANAFQVKDIHLPKKVAYKPRKRERPILTRVDYKYRRGREWEAFLAFREQNPDIPVVEMDTVKSARGCKKTLLTFIFEKSNFMIAFLMKDATQRSVLSVFDYLTDELGVKLFHELFPVILTDNGVEFKDPISLEFSQHNARRTNIFYCDPSASWQKPHVEKNHVELRKIIPKGTSFSKLKQDDIVLLLNHVNSEIRASLDNETPFSRFASEKEKKLLNLMNLHPVPADEVILSPKLLNLRNR